MKLIGLTGGIGSGKSTVSRMLVELGAHLVDTDAISRALTATGGAAMPAIVAAFGAPAQAADGALDRAFMRDLAFRDPAARKRLEGILHPMIGDETRRLEALAAGSPWIVFDVPLLVESGRWRQRVDRVLVVDCTPETQVQRVMARNGWTRDAVLAVLAQQATRAQRRAAADAVIVNEGRDLDSLAQDVRQVAAHWRPTPA